MAAGVQPGAHARADRYRAAGGKLMATALPPSRNTCVSGQPRSLHQHLWDEVLTAAVPAVISH